MHRTEEKTTSDTYHPKTEDYTRRYLYRPPSLMYYGGCSWTINRISRQSIIAITWHVSQQTLLEPLTVTGASVSCFGERYRDVLPKNLDEKNSTQTSTDCCTVVCKHSVTVRVCVCYILAQYSLLGTPAYIFYIVKWNQTLYYLFKEKIRTHLDLLSVPQLGWKKCQNV